MPKPYNTKTLQRNINGAAPEEGGKGKEGLYRHPEAIDAATGKPAELVALSDPLFGNSTADAAVQIGFEYVGPVPEGYVKKLDMVTAQANEGQADSLKGLTARMNQLEGVAERNKELEAQVLKLQEEAKFGAKTDSPAVAESVHQTKVDAADQITARDQGDASGVAGPAPTPEDLPDPEVASQEIDPTTQNPLDEGDEDEGDKTPEKSLSQQNTTELVATAKTEGVELTEDHDTKKKIREAIEAKRNEKKGE